MIIILRLFIRLDRLSDASLINAAAKNKESFPIIKGFSFILLPSKRFNTHTYSWHLSIKLHLWRKLLILRILKWITDIINSLSGKHWGLLQRVNWFRPNSVANNGRKLDSFCWKAQNEEACNTETPHKPAEVLRTQIFHQF